MCFQTIVKSTSNGDEIKVSMGIYKKTIERYWKEYDGFVPTFTSLLTVSYVIAAAEKAKIRENLLSLLLNSTNKSVGWFVT